MPELKSQMERPHMWCDWPGILAENLRQVLEADNPFAIRDAREALRIYDEQNKAAHEAGYWYVGEVQVCQPRA